MDHQRKQFQAKYDEYYDAMLKIFEPLFETIDRETIFKQLLDFGKSSGNNGKIQNYCPSSYQ